MDTKTLIHVGIETVVISGISFYFQRRISRLEGELQLVRDQNAKLNEQFEYMAQILRQHEQYLRGHNLPQPVRRQTVTRPPAEANVQPKPKKEEVIIEDEEEYPGEEELDELLSDELSSLKKENPNYIEIEECNNDECEVSPKKSKKKVHVLKT